MIRPRLGRNYKSPYSANAEDRSKCLNPECPCKGILLRDSGAPLQGAVFKPRHRPRDWRDAPLAPTPTTPREFTCPECATTNSITAREQHHVEGCVFGAFTKHRKFRQPAPPTYHIQKMHIKMVKGAHLPEPKVETTPFWERFKNDGSRTPVKTEDDVKRKSPPFGR